MEKEIIIGLSLMWLLPISVFLVTEVSKLWQEINYLENMLEDDFQDWLDDFLD